MPGGMGIKKTKHVDCTNYCTPPGTAKKGEWIRRTKGEADALPVDTMQARCEEKSKS
jgi:hypothetical protein